MSEDQEGDRTLPTSELDLNLMLTDSVWGKEIPKDLKDKLSRFYNYMDESGEQKTFQSSLWGLLGFFTRDMRLGNLSTFDNELVSCRYMIDLANDLLHVDMPEPFLIALSRSATILETSQSKSGFLRRQMNTLRQEQIKQEIEPPKKGFFGGKKKEGGGY